MKSMIAKSNDESISCYISLSMANQLSLKSSR